LSFHLPGENSRIGPPFVFPHQDWLLVHFLHIFAAKNRSTWVKVFPLPPYWPELNATERIWNYTRKYVTHNRFFERPQDLCDALFGRFDYVRHHPQEIEGLLRPFF
jgi:transposase